ncbi:MAG TPA: hypothetical protein VLN49_05195 [Gemmatimonadaceae bacterium]|nr:hypothetical protein [Gemmatimonadaceae bacterium]
MFREQPQHPGAAHYLIHAYDDPARASNGLEAARAYARIAPSAEHAQHMPSHIFVQLGLWDDAAHSNEQAWVSSRLEVSRQHAPAAALGFHTLNWLQYAYLQQGRYSAARALIDTARTVLAGAVLRSFDRPDARYAVSQLQFRYMRETGDWNAWPVAQMDTNELHLPQGSSERAQSMATNHVFETAIILAMRGDTVPLATVTRRMHDQLDRRGTRPTTAGRARLATFDALLARARGDRESAISLLQSAEAAADSSPPIGPPHLLLLHEQLGSMLSEAGRFGDAAAAYTRGLALTPNRASALIGLAGAEQHLGNTSAADDAYARLRRNWTPADPKLKAMAAGGRSR